MARRTFGTPGRGVWVEAQSNNDMLALFDGKSDPLLEELIAGVTEGLREGITTALVNSEYWPIRSGYSILSFHVTIAATGDRSIELDIRNSARSEGRNFPYPAIVERRTRAAELTILDHLDEIARAGLEGGVATFGLGRSLGRAVTNVVREAEAIDRQLQEGRDV